MPYIGVEHVESMTGTILPLDAGSRVGEGESNTFRFDARHVLYGKLRPYLNKVALPDFEGRCSTELVPLLPEPTVDRAYLAYLLRRPLTVSHAMASVTGARMPRTDMKVLMSMLIPLPSMAEQRRIADILNRAARIERLRRQAAAHLRDLAPALFIELFGDPIENPMRWPTHPFLDLVSDATRKCTKIQKRDYRPNGAVQIVDQGQSQVAGYTDRAEGAYGGPFPVVVFGDHTRRFKLVEAPFFLGADGAKLLKPRTDLLDPTFLFGQCQSLVIEDAGYSRHFRFLKMKSLILPPLDRQTAFARILAQTKGSVKMAEQATALAETLSHSLLDRLFGDQGKSGCRANENHV